MRTSERVVFPEESLSSKYSATEMGTRNPYFVTPAKAGVQQDLKNLDSGFRRDDGLGCGSGVGDLISTTLPPDPHIYRENTSTSSDTFLSLNLPMEVSG